MKPLPPWFAEKLDQLRTEAYLEGVEEGRRQEREEQLEDNRRINR